MYLLPYVLHYLLLSRDKRLKTQRSGRGASLASGDDSDRSCRRAWLAAIEVMDGDPEVPADISDRVRRGARERLHSEVCSKLSLSYRISELYIYCIYSAKA